MCGNPLVRGDNWAAPSCLFYILLLRLGVWAVSLGCSDLSKEGQRSKVRVSTHAHAQRLPQQVTMLGFTVTGVCALHAQPPSMASK